jgi:tellurite resistance protein TehA-like permease
MEAAIARWPVPDKWSGRFSKIVGNMPISYFGIVRGVAGLGNAWRGAERARQLPKSIEEGIYLIAGVVWAALVVIYVLTALLMPERLPVVGAHSSQCCFIGLAGVAPEIWLRMRGRALVFFSGSASPPYCVSPCGRQSLMRC